MKQNKYDDNAFFRKYSQMDRSVKGLEGAGEWKTLERLLPDFRDKDVLDLGCGFGWHCRYAAEHGAASVLGVDISSKMIAKARSMGNEGIIEYRCMPMEDIQLPEASFDIVISSLAFHYTPDFNGVCRNVFRWLKPGGVFIFSVEHPVFTAQGTQDWQHDESGNIMHWPVDRYFMEGPRQAVFLGEEVTKYHRTLTSYLGALAANEFEVTALEEPQPPRELLESVPGMQDELRRPMMLIISARKK